MPIFYSISTDLDLVYARWSGRVSFGDILDNFQVYLADPRYQPGRPELIDASTLRDIDVDFAKARAILRLVNEQVPSAPVTTHTVLWTPGDTFFGLGRMYQQIASLASGVRVEVFRDEIEALAALDKPYDTVAALLREGGFVPQE